MSEEIKKEFLESVQALSIAWCNKSISTEDLICFIRQAVERAENREKKDFSSFPIL
ncbi:MAG: hypothetical protein ACI4NB_03750 [Candidatus Ornithospirochaeta sp.]